MLYLKRKIDQVLLEWKENQSRKPLIIKGPRQVGKTESILKFARENYSNILYINLVEEPKYRQITNDGYSVDSIIKNISLIDPSKKFIPGQTIIFFDELQAFPELATSLKFFCLDKRFDVICSGSLLGIHYHEIDNMK